VFQLKFTENAKEQLNHLQKQKSLKKRCKAVLKTLAYLENNPRHPSLNTHKYSSIQGPFDDNEVFEAYAENKTPVAYRIFWRYGPNKKDITILAITPHP
jgi:hypothetical protein